MACHDTAQGKDFRVARQRTHVLRRLEPMGMEDDRRAAGLRTVEQRVHERAFRGEDIGPELVGPLRNRMPIEFQVAHVAPRVDRIPQGPLAPGNASERGGQRVRRHLRALGNHGDDLVPGLREPFDLPARDGLHAADDIGGDAVGGVEDAQYILPALDMPDTAYPLRRCIAKRASAPITRFTHAIADTRRIPDTPDQGHADRH